MTGAQRYFYTKCSVRQMRMNWRMPLLSHFRWLISDGTLGYETSIALTSSN
jgi:hypothetical protein